VIFFVVILSIAYVVYPIKATVDSTQPVIINSTTFVSSPLTDGYNVSVIRTDIFYASGAHYVSFTIAYDTLPTASCSSRFGMKGGGSIYELTTDPIPIAQYQYMVAQANSDAPNASADSASPASSSNAPDYYWNNIQFIPSGTWLINNAYVDVKYDHPDNYIVNFDGVGLNPNGTPDTAKSYTVQGSNGVKADHLSVSQINSLIEIGQFGGLATAIAGAFIAGASWATAGIGILIGVMLIIVGFVFTQFVQDIIQTELNDGWIYESGVGHWNCWFLHSVWFSLSFGSWWNTWFHFFISNFCGCYCVPT
jgi:hypothetical protein